MIAPVNPLLAREPLSPPTLSDERLQLRKAAEGFEAIMVRKLLETARSASFAEDAPLTGSGMDRWTEMRDERFADIAAQSGAFGFARSIEQQLSQYLAAKEDE